MIGMVLHSGLPFVETTLSYSTCPTPNRNRTGRSVVLKLVRSEFIFSAVMEYRIPWAGRMTENRPNLIDS